jgi:hypothetical protein
MMLVLFIDIKGYLGSFTERKSKGMEYLKYNSISVSSRKFSK